MLKAVIFDFDGVIYNSTHYFFLSRKNFFLEKGVLLKKKDFKKYLSMKTVDFVKCINKDYNLNVSVKEMRRFTRKEFVRLINDNYKPNPGIKSLLKELYLNKIKIAIVSVKRRKVIKYDLKKLGLNDYFKTIISVESVKKHKPYPDGYILACKRLNVLPKDTVGIEDGPSGIVGMNKAGIKSIALITEFTLKKDFKKCDLAIRSIKEINIKKLNKLFFKKS